MRTKLGLSHLLQNLAGLFLTASGLVILAWIGWLTWYDVTSCGKDLALIFLGSRTGEAISLGIGMKVIYYFLISLVLLLSGLFAFLQRGSKGFHHFGYLSSLPKNAPIPRDLIGKLMRSRGKLVAGLTWMTILGAFLSLSPLRHNTVAVVGVFASLSAVMIAFLAAVEIEIVNVEEEKTATEITSRKEKLPYEILSHTSRPLNFSCTNMSSAKTSEFNADIYSSEYQVTLSSYYMPTRAHLMETPHKKRQAQR